MTFKILILSVCVLSDIFCASLTKHSLYEKPDRVDIMLTFDAPYLSKISKTKNENSVILLLDDITDKLKPFSKKLTSSIIQEVDIKPYQNKTLIEIKSKEPFNVTASKTVDNLGLRIRIQSLAITPIKEDIQPITSTPLPKVEPFNFTFAFLKVLLVLGLMIAFLWGLKRWIERKNSSGSWLFATNEDTDTIKILTQKPIDMKNKVTLIAFKEKQYLVLLGENNLLLDAFHTDEANAFDTLLQKNSQKLGDYLKE